MSLEAQDEENGEWREQDKVIDNAGFNAIAYIVRKDVPYEKVIEFVYNAEPMAKYKIYRKQEETTERTNISFDRNSYFNNTCIMYP